MKAIINLSTPQYHKGQQRLIESLRPYNGFYDQFYKSEEDVGSPPHSQLPYGFKIYAFEKALSHGYRKILWLDASVYAVKDPKPVFDWIDEHGYFMEEAGHYCGDWCNENARNILGVTKEQIALWPMFSAGFVGLDFDNPIAAEFFDRWKSAMLAGAFQGSWETSRHDMAAGSVIANQMGLKYSTGGTYFAYVGEAFGTPKETVVFHLQGMV